MKIQINNMSKQIKGSLVLDGISAEMESGQIYGLSGVNGSGKTMLMRALSGLILPTEGEILVDGKRLGKEISFPARMGLLLEHPAFLPGYTGFCNLKLLAAIRGTASDEDIRRALSDVGLDPDDKRKYKKYSLGMKQRLGIACAIAENPDLIILDEPFNALDEAGIRQIECLLHRWKEQGKLIVLSCHNREQMEHLADRIFKMENGRLSEESGYKGKEDT